MTHDRWATRKSRTRFATSASRLTTRWPSPNKWMSELPGLNQYFRQFSICTEGPIASVRRVRIAVIFKPCHLASLLRIQRRVART